jgi:NAD+ diphosphatase
MGFRFLDVPSREASQFVGFAGNVIEPRSEYRDDDAVEKALLHDGARILLMRSGRIFLKHSNGRFEPYYALAETAALQARIEHAVLLGRAREGPVLAAPAGLDPEALPETIKAIDYRSVYVQGLLEPAALGALAQGAALLAWHANHRFCGRCGQPTEMRAGGYKRCCAGCGGEHFPRTDPVAIMLAIAGDRCLLGRSHHFQPGMYSCLAGFIEPGETVENAVRRETFEEAGIRIGRVAYHASQPWPFPYSLMIGCFAEALDEEIVADTAELDDCRWFSRQEIGSIIRGDSDGGVFVPPRGAIANHLIRTWVEEA